MNKYKIAELLLAHGTEVYRLCGDEWVERMFTYYNEVTDYTTMYAVVYDDVNNRVLDCYKFYGHEGRGDQYELRKDYPYYLEEGV